jgi:hypothetical protein
MGYTSLEAAKKFGGFTGSQDDELLAAMIEAATNAIINYTGRHFTCTEETAKVFKRRSGNYAGLTDPFDGPVLLFDEDLAEPASAITDSPTVTYLGDGPYYGAINEDSVWYSPVTVTGFWAYSKTPPPDIEIACLRLVKWLYGLRQTTPADSVVVTEHGAVLLPSRLPADVMVLLAPYRGPRAAG